MTVFSPENRDLYCYLITKHSWKGKFKRIFSIGTHALSTYNPTTLEITNQWPYDDVVSIKPIQRSACGQDEFSLHVKSKKKSDNMRFSSEYAADVISAVLEKLSFIDETKACLMKYNGYKHHWSGRRVQVMLFAKCYALEQADDGKVVATYKYKSIHQIIKISSSSGFIIEYGKQRRQHLFVLEHRDALIDYVRKMVGEFLGMDLPVEVNDISVEDFEKNRLGLCSYDEQLTSYVEFNVQKFTSRRFDPIRRLLCISETCLIERDPATYCAVCARPLKSIVCITRCETDMQKFSIHYADDESRSYSSTERDLILASIIDGSRASNNLSIFVLSATYQSSLRLLPHDFHLDEDSEALCMRLIISPPPGLKRFDLIRRFNFNIPYSGLIYPSTQESFFTENKGKLILNCLEALLSETYSIDFDDAIQKSEAQLHCLRRLFASKSGFEAFTTVPGFRERLGKLVISMLKLANEVIDHATVEMLCALMQPMHSNYELRLEQLNKQSLLFNRQFVEHLLDLVVNHVERSTGALVIASMLDFLTYAICSPYSETTSGTIFDSILTMVSSRGHSFFHLFQYPCMTIVKGAGLIMRAIVEEASVDVAKHMQLLSLTKGSFLIHLHTALFSSGQNLRVLANKQLSGQLVSLWLADNNSAMNLLARCVPRGLLDYLDSMEKPDVSTADLLVTRNNLQTATSEAKRSVLMEQVQYVQATLEAKFDQLLQHWNVQRHLSLSHRKDEIQKQPVVLRKRRRRIKTVLNWKMFSYQFTKDHSKADLIWNEKTREDFRRSVEDELRAFEQEKGFTANDVQISWNHTDFQVRYTSLVDEIKIGDYYLRLLLQETESNATPIHNPLQFFSSVYHRFLLSAKAEMRCLCLKAMALTYGRHFVVIGSFDDSKYIVSMLAKCTNSGERDHLILFISKLVLDEKNVRSLVSAGLLPILVDLALLSHLHSDRAFLPSQIQTNLIESNQSSEDEGCAEWYYTDKVSTRRGPVTFAEIKKLYNEKSIYERTQIWAQGLDQWTILSSVAQFRWTICCLANAEELYNFTELCVTILDIFIQMCMYYPSRDQQNCIIRPLSLVKRTLSEPLLLNQIVQLLLTYEPSIVHRIASLLLHIMEDNPFVSRLYLSGVFFFILMYNGSNILPIARFLHYTNLKQAFRSSLGKSEFVSHSILSPMLPEAAVFYLEEYGAEKYAQMFLGEYDNPEVIWNMEMRRHLVERIALHISDFSIRLSSNIRVLYQYCPIPSIKYSQLDGELFCHVYYLRHLCNTIRFGDWPIRDPLIFLRSCLSAWLNEIEKKLPMMSLEQAFDILELPCSDEILKDHSSVRRAYFKLAQKYHPDKNPLGREQFEEVNYAYEYLSSNMKQRDLSPDIERIILCIQAQSIVYKRYCEEFSPFKYAGYIQLIKTIGLESKADSLFAKENGKLLCVAVELCRYTLISSDLNAEQLRRDGGLEALLAAFERCSPLINRGSTDGELQVETCIHILHCFATASKFELCRDKISTMTIIFSNICRLLQFDNVSRVVCASAECICAFAVCTLLQMQLFQAGVIWQLLPHLFRYDYTLEEGGVEHCDETNQQSLKNQLARKCLEALARLGGFRGCTPENDGVQNSLRSMLTPYICGRIRQSENDCILKVLNGNTKDPNLIWDNATRSELLEFVEFHRTSNVNKSELYGAEFKFSIYANELIVGGIFVRIYNQHPHFKFEDQKKFFVDLLNFLSAEQNKMFVRGVNGMSKEDLDDFEGNPAETSGQILKNIEDSMEAMLNLLKFNPGLEVLLINNFVLIFSFLKEPLSPSSQDICLAVISVAASNVHCLMDIASSSHLPVFFGLIFDRPETVPTVLKLFIVLSSVGKCVKEILEYGGLIYILSVFCDSQFEKKARILAAELLAKLQADKLTGPRWSRFINRYLPPIFADALRDSAQTSVLMFDSNHENPELIWNDAMRGRSKDLIHSSCKTLHEAQKIDSCTKWDLVIADFCIYDDINAQEVVIGGVYLRLFIANPSWQVRYPKQFATELMERVLEQIKRPSSEMDIIFSTFVALLKNHPAVADQLPAQGYLPHYCSVMLSMDLRTSRSALVVFCQLVENTSCADAFARLNCIDGLLKSMRNEPTLLLEASRALKSLLQRNSSNLVGQVLSTGMVEYLLSLLGSNMLGVGNSAAAKAEIVDALKAACLDMQFGEKIQLLLDKSSVWPQYKDQRHDLFLASSCVQAVGGTTGIAGYLTERMFSTKPATRNPPPIKPED